VCARQYAFPAWTLDLSDRSDVAGGCSTPVTHRKVSWAVLGDVKDAGCPCFQSALNLGEKNMAGLKVIKEILTVVSVKARAPTGYSSGSIREGSAPVHSKWWANVLRMRGAWR
jgi:hypothetical protein